MRDPDLPADPAETAVTALAAARAGLAAGEARPEQEAMARAVGTALASGRHLVVQAGTGTGKSLAYLAPAVASGRKVVVATATKALQDQLATKDLPVVVAGSPRPVTFAVLKGRSNYLCRQRAAEIGGAGVQPELDEAGEEGDGAGPGGSGGTARLVEQVRRLVAWGEQSETGDRGELDFEPSDRAWRMVSVAPRECPGAHRCPSGPVCFAERARDAAAAADVVVVNTHLYGAHLSSGGSVLPEHEVVVFDEAHEVEGIMTASLGVDVTAGRFRALATLARPVIGTDGGRVLDDLVDVGGRLADSVARRTGTRVLRPVPAGGSRPADPGDGELARLLERASARMADVLAHLRRAESEASASQRDRGARRNRALSAAGHLATDVARLVAARPDEVLWVDGPARSPELRLSPVDVAPALAGALWGEVTAVLTSATIPLRLTEQLGLSGFDVDEIDVGSPFDYRNHALLYVARHLPDRRDPAAEPAIHRELEALIGAAGGRTLALFTSRRATEAAAAALEGALPGRLLVQGTLPKSRLLGTFADDETSSLFATLGFWQGVDVPGRSLSLVTLDRLPFSRPDDPVLEARRELAGPQAFRIIDLPRAATLLAQGAGRLIRTAEDRGVVAVLDSRLATADYRRVLLARFPPMRRTTDFRQVADFLQRILAPAPSDRPVTVTRPPE